MSNGVIPLKRPYMSPNIAPRGSECENNLREVMAWESFPGVEFDPCFTVKWGHHTKTYLFILYY